MQSPGQKSGTSRACLPGALRGQRRNTHSSRVLADHKSQGLGCRGSGGCSLRPAREAGGASESHGPGPARTSPRGGRLAPWPPSGSPARPSGCRATGGAGRGWGKEGLGLEGLRKRAGACGQGAKRGQGWQSGVSGQDFISASGSAFPCPGSFNYPIKLFKIISEGPTMCCSERPSGLAHSRSLSPKVLDRIQPTCLSSFTCMICSVLGISSVAQPCRILCDPMDCSMPGFPVHRQLLELTQTHVHGVTDAIQPSHPLLSPSPLAFSLSQHQGLFQRVSSSHQVAKVLALQLQPQSFQ